MKKIVLGMIAIAAIVAIGLNRPVTAGVAISGSAHDFMSSGIGAKNMCSTCHSAHAAKKAQPLWARNNPSSTYAVWNGNDTTGAALTGTGNYVAAAAFAGSNSGMCLSCHDGATAVGGSMYTTGAANLGTDLKKSHPVGFVYNGTGANGLLATPDVDTPLEGTAVGCTSCHSMHSSATGVVKLQRKAEVCLGCHIK
ncbi:MAG: hypothetical protein HZB91_06275 [Elusimicrobia bacterium]|nr:hypothetical protein [Elusimicrobiota bacterium]